MSQLQASARTMRQHTRYTVPAMYSLVRARSRDEEHFCRTGHVYDISLGGMRFELDEPIPPGQDIDLRAMLPGPEHVTFRATGTIKRLHNDDPDDRGPTRLAVEFKHFPSHADRRCVEQYLAGRNGHAEAETEPAPPRPFYASADTPQRARAHAA